MKITSRMKQFLEFMEEKEQVSLFPIEWGSMRKKAINAGYIQKSGLSEQTGFISYELTSDGYRALHGPAFNDVGQDFSGN